MADVVVQFREGVFPVFVGQSDFQFNGAVYPHRVAPYHQYLAGLIDLLTGRSLGFVTLQHLTIILSFVGGAVGAYAVLTRLDPARRWEAVALSLLYVACPGVMGLAYAQDLYMSVMTLPWVPVALGGAWLTYRENSLRALGLIVTGLGALWWSHPPIALWVSLAIGVQQAHRLAIVRPVGPLLTKGALGVAILGLLIYYPVVSAYQLRAPGESVVPYIMDRSLLLKEIHDAFPASVLPLNPAASRLSQLQLGYSLWAVFAGLLVYTARRRSRPGLLTVAMAGFALILVLPVPGITSTLWRAFPEALVGLSLYWPMQRLYVLAAALLIVGWTITLAGTTLSRTMERWLRVALLAGLGWSVSEAWRFQKTARETAAFNAGDEIWSRTENVTPTRHAYHLFSRRPATMSHGVMDPTLESRLIDPVTQEPLPLPSPAGEWQTFTGSLDANPGILNLEPALVLEPGHRHLLTFDFFERDYTGVLQIKGSGFDRDYLLPSSGNTRAFGSGPEAARTLSLWTSNPTRTEVRLRFIPTQPGARADSFTPFARFTFTRLEEAPPPVRVVSLIPYRALVSSPQPALLETPRMAVPGYVAQVQGEARQVTTTRDGFVAVPVPEGSSEVVLHFAGSALLRTSFWISLLTWLGVTGAWALLIVTGASGWGALLIAIKIRRRNPR